MFCLFSVSLRVDYSFNSDTELPLGVLSTCCTLLMWMMLLLLLQMRLLRLLQLLQHLFLFRWSLALLAWGAPIPRILPTLPRHGDIHTPFHKNAAGSRTQCSAACSRCRSRSCCCCYSNCVAWPQDVRLLESRIKKAIREGGICPTSHDFGIFPYIIRLTDYLKQKNLNSTSCLSEKSVDNRY